MNSSKQSLPLNISFPEIIGFMSVDVARNYHGDLTQLKFLNTVPNRKVNFDLNNKIDEAVKRTTDDNNEKINLLLKFLVDRTNYIKQRKEFITYRRTLIAIMCNAYHADHISIMACLYNGSIYLCLLETPREKQRRQNRNKKEEKFCAWGYKFEQYLLSDLPSQLPDVDKPVIENEEFSLYFRSSLEDHDLLYGAQIDGLLASNANMAHPPKTDEFETNLNYLRRNQYVELKTNREIQNHRQEHNFKKYKLLRCWCQCYLAGLKGLVVGFRDDNVIVKRLQYFNTDDIVTYCKHEWHPEKALSYLNNFLTFIKTSFNNKLREGNSCNHEPFYLQFEDYGDSSITVLECSSIENDVILPEWFVKTK